MTTLELNDNELATLRMVIRLGVGNAERLVREGYEHMNDDVPFVREVAEGMVEQWEQVLREVLQYVPDELLSRDRMRPTTLALETR